MSFGSEQRRRPRGGTGAGPAVGFGAGPGVGHGAGPGVGPCAGRASPACRARRVVLVIAALLSVAPMSGLLGQPVNVLTLEEALGLAISRSPELRQARARELQTAGGQWDGVGALLPSVSVSTGLNRSIALQRTASDPITGGIVELPDSLVDRRRTFGTQVSVGAAWTLFDAAQLLGAGTARQEHRAAEAGLRAARVRVTADVILAYLDAVEADALAEVRRRELERDAEVERTARARYELGAVPEVELLQAQLNASNSEIALLDAEGAVRSARMRVLELIGLEPDPTIELAPPPELDRLPDVSWTRADALEGSAVLEELDAARSAARWDARAGRLGFLPTVTLGLGWGWSEFGGTQDALTFEPRNSQSSLRLSFSWSALQPLGGVFGDRLRAQATEVAAIARYDAGRAALEREILEAQDRISRAWLLQERIDTSLELAERQVTQADERYRLGLAPLVERLAAGTLWAEAARQEVLVRYAPVRALTELERATGVAFWLAEVR